MAVGRALSPERIVETCNLGLSRVFSVKAQVSAGQPTALFFDEGRPVSPREHSI